MVAIDLSIYNIRGMGPSHRFKKNKKKTNLISHNASVFQRMFSGFEHLPHSLLPTLMLAKMVVRA